MKSFRIAQTIAVGALLVGLSAQSPAQAGVPSFEKQGRYIASDAGLSLAKRHANVAQSAPLGPYDILHYALDLQAAMVTEDFGGRDAAQPFAHRYYGAPLIALPDTQAACWLYADGGVAPAPLTVGAGV